jgi:hypothetical protein
VTKQKKKKWIEGSRGKKQCRRCHFLPLLVLFFIVVSSSSSSAAAVAAVADVGSMKSGVITFEFLDDGPANPERAGYVASLIVDAQ